MAAVAELAENTDVLYWLDELQDAVERAHLLTSSARVALVAVIDSFAAEDGFLHPSVCRARATLDGSPVCETPSGNGSGPSGAASFSTTSADSRTQHVHDQ